MYSNLKYYNTPVASPYGIIVDINGVQSTVPIDPANIDYTTIMELVDMGKITIALADEINT